MTMGIGARMPARSLLRVMVGGLEVIAEELSFCSVDSVADRMC